MTVSDHAEGRRAVHLVEQPGVGCEVVGVERRCVHRGGTGIAECLNLVVEDPLTTRGQHDRCPSSQSQRQLDADLAATAEKLLPALNAPESRSRVLPVAWDS
jgi:hypothetical protein